MLNFLNIAAFAGLAGIVVPLLIHLFARRKAGTILFSSLKFFRTIESQAIRRLKLTELLLLILRTLAVFCIVVAFAHPVLKGVRAASGQGGSVRTAVILDRSPSTDAAGPFSVLQQRTLQILNVAGSGGRTALFWSDTLSTDLVDADPAMLRRSVMKMTQATLRKGDLGSSLQRALEWVNRGQAADREILLLSDLQRSNLPQSKDTAAAVINGGLVLFPLERLPMNIGITDCGVEKQILRPGGTVTVFVDVTASGGEGTVTITIQCIQNGKTAARRFVSMTAPGTRRFLFDVPAEKRGWNRCFAEIDDDRFMPDNRRYFCYHIPEQVRILLMGSDAESLELPALALLAAEASAPLFSISKAPFTTAQPVEFQGFDVVVLADYPLLTLLQADALRTFIMNGGTCIFVPGSSIDLKMYDERFFYPLLGVRSELKRASEGYHTLGRIDREHAIITPMFEHEYSPANPLHIHSYIDFSGPPGRDIISLSGGAPFLSEYTAGGGKCLVFSSGLDVVWSNLPLTTFFAPLLFQCALYGGSGGNSAVVSGDVGDPITLSCDASLIRQGLQAVTPAGVTIRLIPALNNGRMILHFGGTPETGIYDIFAGDSLLACAAVNIDPEESEMAFHNGESLQLLYPGLTIETADPAKPVEEYLRRKRYGRELWREMLAAGLVLLAVEMIVAGSRVRDKQRSMRNLYHK